MYGPTAGKTYEILRYGSSGVTGYTNLLVDYRGTLTNDAVNQVISFIASGDGHSTRTWNTLNGTWDLAVSDNWAEGDHLFYKGDHAVFGNISTDVVVTVSGTLYPASVTISADNNQYTFSGGTIAGYTDISKTGNGVCEIAMANRQKGTIRAKAGTIKVGHAEAFGAHFAGSPVDQVVVSAGATVDFNGVIDANYGYIIAGNGVGNVGALINSGSEISTAKKQCRRINLAADASIGGINNWALLNAGYQPTTLELNGHTLTKIGSNTISFVNTTISTGTVRIAAGVLAQYNTGIVGGSQTMFELDNTPSATFALNNISTAIGGISGGGKISLGSGALTVGLLNTANTFHGAFLGSGKLIKAGTNVLVISGTSPLFTGNVMVNGGTLKLDQYNQQNILGATRADVNKIQVATGATLDIGGLDDTYYGVTIAGSGVDGKGALINSGAGTSLGRIQTPFLALAGDATIGGVGNFAMIAGNYYPNAITLNGFKLTKTGVNTFTVASTTIATGEVHIAQGVFAQHTTLAAGSTTVDASCARFTLADAAGVELRLNNKAFSAGSLEGGGVTGGLVSLGSAKLTLGNLATNALFSGTITGSGGIIKVGGGTQGFNGVYNYSGPTVVSNGTLVVNGTHQSGGSYTVVNNAVLAGSGSVSVATGSVTIEAGGAISPGAQAMAGGTLTVNTLTMATDAKLIIDNLEDSLIVTGNLWLDNARVLVSDTTQLDKARTYQLVTCNGNVTGAFNKKVDDSLWVVSRRGSTFALVYSSGAVMLIR